MRTDNGSTKSLWMETSPGIPAKSLVGDAAADVCVVGAGIAGLSVAYHLAQAGKTVIVVDDGPIAGGETSRTTAHLANAMDDGIAGIVQQHGMETARLVVDSHTQAIARIEQIAQEEAIACDFERLDGYLFCPPDGDAAQLDAELEAAHGAGLHDVEKVDRAPIPDFDTGPALRFPRQGQFHVLKYLQGVAQAIERMGGKLYTGVHASEFRGGQNASVKTEQGQIVACKAIVVATNVPVNERLVIHTKQMPYRTFALAACVPQGKVTRALYWDTLDPYHYVRLQNGGDGREYLIVGGEDHKTGHEDDADARWARLEAWARERWPMIEEVAFRWSGQVAEPQDALAFIGRNPLDADNVYVVTGDSGMGMTHGTIAGMLLRDLILGRENPWEKIYDPGRIKLSAASEFVKEHADSFSQYGAWLSGGDVSSENEIKAGEGAVLRDGLTKCAVYRDGSGAMHRMSAVCPHLAAIVQWNSAEKTWDCPAHGSRFDCTGHVINGPANSDLAAVDAPEKAA